MTRRRWRYRCHTCDATFASWAADEHHHPRIELEVGS